jgi:hypothetical protein
VFALTLFCVGVFLDPIAEDRRVSEWVASLERILLDTSTFWANACRCGALVLLQDCTQHIGEAVDGCRKALMTMFSVMLPRNPFSKYFGQLLEIFKTSQRIHRLKGNLILLLVSTLLLPGCKSGTRSLTSRLSPKVCLLPRDPDQCQCRSTWMLCLTLLEG